ncbi:choice-of-anchor J domain-containing protein [Prevotella multiformis]|uniref:choice-of-anchor J domain-containing protein n=1 Tax=Prevotella multiformis TaxID=282402 RepID=UPI0028DD1BDF|nr:choice-of-anchor J domain-containing protein [Prevotella multiformis]
MKKIIFSMMALALTATAFTGCEDVPAPYSMNFDDSNVTPTPKPAADPKGSGTVADPFNVAAALKYIEAGQNLDKQVYVSGTIVSVKEIDATNYGNATYYISDDGTASGQLTVYRGYDLGNKKFTAADRLKAGDKVVVYGKLVNFNGTKEFTQGNYIYSLNGKKAEDTPAADLNTEATAWTVAEAVQKIQAGQTAGGEAYVKGIISAVTYYDAAHKSLTYYLSDNGTDKVLQVFSGKGLNGADFAAKTDLQAGQTVVVKGNLKSFTNKKGQVVMEVDKDSKIVSISGTPSPQPSVAALTAKFDAGMDNFTTNDISLPSQLTYIWKHDASRKYMKASSHKGTSDYAAQSRLESPVFSLAGRTSATLTFMVAGNYFSNATSNFKVQVSTDGTTWNDVPLSTYPAKDWKFVATSCDLSAYAGQSTVRIGFLYACDGANAAGTWEIKDVEVK